MGEVFLKLLNMSLSASFLIAAVILLRLVLKKAPKWTRGILWALVAVRLLCLFSLESKLSLVPDVDVNDLAHASLERGEQAALEEIGGADGPTVTFEAEIPAVITLPDDFQPSEPAEGFSLTITGADIAAAVWLAGVLVMLLYALISYLRLRRRVAAALSAGEGVWLCDAVESPFILGLFRPRIYLPSNISGEDTAYVLAHERAHLARRDHWWKPLGFLLLAVYWFNPLVWVAYVLLCRDIELACDEKVVRALGEGEKKAYSEALLSCSLPRKMISACPLAFGEVGVKARIKSVLNYKKPAFWIILLAVIACIAAAVCFLTDPLKPTLDDITQQNGYGITSITTGVEMDIKIPVDALGEDIYSALGHTYKPNEVVLYQSESTTLYLRQVCYLDQYGEEELFFNLYFDYAPSASGTIRTIVTPEIKDGEMYSAIVGGGIANKTAWDSVTTYPDSIRHYGSNWAVEVSVAVKTDVVRNAQDYIAFTLGDLTDITYKKGPANHEDHIIVNTYDADPWEVQVTLELDQTVDPEAAAIAREYVQNIVYQQNDIYDPDNTLVNAYYYTAAKVTGLERINTGTAALDHSIDLYKLEYRLLPSDMDKVSPVGFVHEENGWITEQTSAGQPYLVILSEEQGTSLIGVTHETVIQGQYGTKAMLEQYGNAYTAAAMEIYKAYKAAGALAGYTQAYQSSACLYMNPLSSFLPINGDSGNRYLMDGNRFAVVNKYNGATTEYEMPNGGWQQFPYTEEEWAALFWPEGSGAVDISGYARREWRPVEMNQNLLFLCRMDDELWLVDQRGNEQMGQYIWSIYLLQPEHWSSDLQPEQTEPPAQGATTLEEAVHQAILDYHAPQQPDGLFYCESHTILKTKEWTAAHPVTGDERRFFNVYAVVWHAGYNSAVRQVTGSHIPTALTFAEGEDGTYELLEFWLPRDGSYYADDIREKFPTLTAIAALDLQQYVEKHRADCDAQAAQYFGTNEPEGAVQKISETTDFTEWKGYTAVLTRNITLKDPYSYLLHSTKDGSDLILSCEWIDLDVERELRKGDILLVIGEENGKSRVSIPYGDMPWIYGWVDSSLLSTNQRNIQTGNQAILKGCPTYKEAGGNQNGEANARVQILSLGQEWAWVEEYGTGAKSYWVKIEDLNFDFDSATVLDRPVETVENDIASYQKTVQDLEWSDDPLTYEERLAWVQSGEVYTQTLESGGETSSISLDQWQEKDGYLAYLWQPYGSPHPGVCGLTLRLPDGTQAKLPLPSERIYRTARPTFMEFQNGKLIYEVYFSDEGLANGGQNPIHLKGTYHYEVDLTAKTVSLDVLQE